MAPFGARRLQTYAHVPRFVCVFVLRQKIELQLVEMQCYWDCMPLPGLIIPFFPLPRPFLDCHVWLTQSAATRMGGFTHPLKAQLSVVT